MPDQEDTLLTDLCTICHIHPPKYRCPRCSTRTCSLPCTKRHKLWSQCNGVRDPGAYLKRSELATPKAIDQDFNFISSIERTIERAGVDAEGRGVRLRPGRQNAGAKSGGQEKGEVALGRALERAQVIVNRAPKGMARSKANATRWLNRSKQIAWSVEWRTPEDAEVQHDCLESGTLEDLYGSFLRSKEPKAKKRKIRHGAGRTGQDEGAGEATITSNSLEEAGDQRDSELPTTQEESSSDQTLPLKRPSPPSAQQPPRRFYLRRPHTPSSQPTVLIPLSASETLTSALLGKVVLEFPTIYVFTDGADELPAGYVTEEAYLDGQRKEDLVLRCDVDEGGEEEGLEEGELGEMRLPGIDEKRVLEVLRKDIGIGIV